MSALGWKNTGFKKDTQHRLLDYGALKVILLASVIIVLAVLVAGGASYTIAKNAAIKKLKTRDFNYIIQSIGAKIDGRIARAKETSCILAADPLIKAWINGRESDNYLGQMAKQKITDIANNYDYDNAFIVSAYTHHYWAEDGRLIDTVSSDDPDDSWFFQTIQSKKPVSISIDYNNERKNTFAFVNALMEDADKPAAVVGVGINFEDISMEFQSYTFGDKSNMWLIDDHGDIYISEDTAHTGRNLTYFLPAGIVASITSDFSRSSSSPSVLEYKNKDGILYDLVYQQLQSMNWKLVLQLPRNESISFTNAIKINTIITCIVIIILLVFMFYFVSGKIANPYKRAVQLAQEMELLVNERTLELKDKNEKILDSIEYAKMIQESILPATKELQNIFKEYFMLWKPRDIVGGDFYYVKSFDSGSVVILGDCTGHGVPGALMTMTVTSILNYFLDGEIIRNPAEVLKSLNILLKQNLYGRDTSQRIDDGLDAGVVFIPPEGDLVFAGARIPLYVKDAETLCTYRGNRKGIGYKHTEDEYAFTNYYIPVHTESIYYMTTDGFIHQNGGDKDFSFGKSRFEALIEANYNKELSMQGNIFDKKLRDYMGGEPQRDDITVMGFKPLLP